jgi:hypothetical protein
LVSLTIAELGGGRQNISKVMLLHSDLSTLRFIMGKSAMLKRTGGLIAFMGNSGDGRVGAGFYPAISKKLFPFQLRILPVSLRK